jgi:hypothetical protein
VKDTGVVGGYRLKADSKGLYLIGTIEEQKPCAAFFVFKILQRSVNLVYTGRGRESEAE